MFWNVRLFHIIVVMCLNVVTYVAYAPRYGALFAGSGSLIGLTFDAKIHNVISANSTVVNHDI